MSRYEEVNVRGYEEFCKAVSERQGKDIYAYFSGDKDDQGKSWCPDCVKGKLISFTISLLMSFCWTLSTYLVKRLCVADLHLKPC